MKRYCVSQVGSNVIYVFSTPEEADEQMQVLGGKGRLWFVDGNDAVQQGCPNAGVGESGQGGLDVTVRPVHADTPAQGRNQKEDPCPLRNQLAFSL